MLGPVTGTPVLALRAVDAPIPNHEFVTRPRYCPLYGLTGPVCPDDTLPLSNLVIGTTSRPDYSAPVGELSSVLTDTTGAGRPGSESC